MSREIKIGVLTFVVMVTMIWGYTFLKGRNLLSTSNELYSTYEDVTDLNVSSPVLVNGYKIGTVTKIKLNPSDVKKMDVFYLIDSEYKIPKAAVANLKSLGFVAGKGIFIEFNKECSGNDCAVDGDQLKGQSIGLIGSMIGTEDLSGYSAKLSESVREVIRNLGKEGEEGAMNEIIRNLELTTQNLASLTASTTRLLEGSEKNLNKTFAGLAVVSQSLAQSNKKIEGMLANMDKISGDLASANLGNTISKTNASLDQLSATLVSASATMEELTALLQKVQKGDGTVAKLVNDRKLYENLESTTKNLNLLLQDLRLNPKRYAHFSVFGKKQESYTLPDNDPANQAPEKE